MYWEYGTKQVQGPIIPYYLSGTEAVVSLNLVTEAGEDLVGCALITLYGDYAGLLKAKLHSGSEYLSIGALNDGTCFLGDFAAETTTQIDFKIAMPSTIEDGLKVIPIALVQGASAQTWPEDWSTLLSEDWPELWSEDWPN